MTSDRCECCGYWTPEAGSRLCYECARELDRDDVNERAARGEYDEVSSGYSDGYSMSRFDGLAACRAELERVS